MNDGLFPGPSGEKIRDPMKRAQELSKRELPRKFYKDVSVKKSDSGYAILLDGKGVKTPARHQLIVCSDQIANVLVEEWKSQSEFIDPATMPVTRMINSTLDGVEKARSAMCKEIGRFVGTDMLFYRASDPKRLVERQKKIWGPVVSWIEGLFEIHVVLIEGIVHQEQDLLFLEKVEQYANSLSDFRLAGLHVLVTLMGSSVLGLAIAEQFLSADSAWEIAHLDEDWNSELWGSDEDATERRNKRTLEMRAAALLLKFGH